MAVNVSIGPEVFVVTARVALPDASKNARLLEESWDRKKAAGGSKCFKKQRVMWFLKKMILGPFEDGLRNGLPHPFTLPNACHLQSTISPINLGDDIYHW